MIYVLAMLNVVGASAAGDAIPDRYSLQHGNDVVYQAAQSDEDTGTYLLDYQGNDTELEIAWQLSEHKWYAGLRLRRTNAKSDSDRYLYPYYPPDWNFRQDFVETGIGFVVTRRDRLSNQLSTEIGFEGMAIRREGSDLLLGPFDWCDSAESACPYRRYYDERESLMRFRAEMRYQPARRLELFFGAGYMTSGDYSEFTHEYGLRWNVWSDVALELRSFDDFLVKGESAGIRIGY